MVTASEEEWPALIKCPLYAKFYTKPLCSHSHPMLGLLILGQKSSKSGKTSHAMLKWKAPEKRTRFLQFSLLLHPTWWSRAPQNRFARWGSVSTSRASVSLFVCTGEMGQGCRSTSWLRKSWVLTFQVCTQNKEGVGKGWLQNWTFGACLFFPIKVTCKVFCFIQQAIYAFIKYFLSSYYTRHLKGE